jgi:hypothetical protein
MIVVVAEDSVIDVDFAFDGFGVVADVVKESEQEGAGLYLVKSIGRISGNRSLNETPTFPSDFLVGPCWFSASQCINRFSDVSR